MRLHEADPDVVAYQEIRLKGKDNVVCAQMYDKEGKEYQQEWAQGVLLLVRTGLSVVQDKKVGARGRRAVYDVATEHGQVAIINCHVPHGRRVKEYVAQLSMEYIRALERGTWTTIPGEEARRQRWTAKCGYSWWKCGYRMCPTVGRQAPHTTRQRKAPHRRG